MTGLARTDTLYVRPVAHGWEMVKEGWRRGPFFPTRDAALVAAKRKAKSALFVDEVDEALYAAHDRVLKAAGPGGEL